MDEKTAQALRAPFPAELIGKRPQPTCRDCSRSPSKVCDRHQKIRCDDCGQWITTAHIHLDFVGHADTTDRFLSVDPDWGWEPLAFDDRGLPAFDQHGGMWIKLTIAGVTRLGYGDAQGKTGPNAVKEAIGDALRNAGMRFGVGLDMWRKETGDEPESTAPPNARQQRPQPPAEPPTDQAWLSQVKKEISAARTGQALQAVADKITAANEAGNVAPGDGQRLYQLYQQKQSELGQTERPAA